MRWHESGQERNCECHLPPRRRLSASARKVCLARKSQPAPVGVWRLSGRHFVRDLPRWVNTWCTGGRDCEVRQVWRWPRQPREGDTGGVVRRSKWDWMTSPSGVSDDQAAVSCNAKLVDLEQEFDAAEDRVGAWLHEYAAYSDCIARQGMKFFNGTSWGKGRKRPANDNGRES